MKNRIITICVILAALMSFMSFAAVLTQMNAKGDEPEEVTVEAPDLKSFILIGEMDGTIYGTFYYREGMTWDEWIFSEYNTDRFELDGDVAYDGMLISASSGTEEDSEGNLVPKDSLGNQGGQDVIEYPVYYV